MKPDAAPSALPLVMPTRQRRRGAAYRDAAATSGRGIPRRGSDVGARGIPRCGSDVGAGHTATRQRRRGAAYRVAAATSGRGIPRCGSDVGARHTALRQRRRGAAYRDAAATSGRGIPRRGSDVGARGIPRRGSDVGARHTATRQRRRGAGHTATRQRRRGTACRAPTPTPHPLSTPCGRRGWGDEGQRRIGMQNIAHLSQKTLHLRGRLLWGASRAAINVGVLFSHSRRTEYRRPLR
jgi:hypothetical protein